MDLRSRTRDELETLVNDLSQEVLELKGQRPFRSIPKLNLLINSLAHIGDELPFLIMINDLERQQNVWMSKRATDHFGITNEQVRHRGLTFFMDVVHPSDREVIDQTRDHLLQHRPNDPRNQPFSALVRAKHIRGGFEWIMMVSTTISFTTEGRALLGLHLIHSVSDQLARHGLFAPDRTEALVQENLRLRESLHLLGSMTRRERQILEMVAQELTSEEIGERLRISANTVRTHRKNLLRKLKLHNTAGLVRFAAEVGILK